MEMRQTLQLVVRSRTVRVALGATGIGAAVAIAAGLFEPVSFLITLGGALGVTAIAFPRARIASAVAHVLEALGPEADPEVLIRALKKLSRVQSLEGARALEHAAAAAPDPFLRSAVALALECRDGDELRAVLAGEARRLAAEGDAARHVVATLARLLPAFGLIGTLLGLGLLLRDLGGAARGALGSGLGMAVMTTLYGAVLANAVVLPIATKLQSHLARQALRRQMIVEGVLLLHRGEFASRIERVLRAYGGPREETRDAIRLARRAA
jgi:chemotaxis protein MotA